MKLYNALISGRSIGTQPWCLIFFSVSIPGAKVQITSSLCLLQISAECELETCAWLLPSVAHCSPLPPPLPPFLPGSLFPSLITNIQCTTHPPTGFLSFSLPFDFIYCSRSVLIYLCCLTSHSDNLLSALSALQPSVLSLSNLAPISVFLMASFEVRTAVIFIFCANICKLITSKLGLVGSTLVWIRILYAVFINIL